MSTTKAQRNDALNELQSHFQDARGIYIADNNKLDVARTTKIRNTVRKEGMQFFVVKNTIAKIAARRTGKENIESFFKGPVAVIISKNDPAAPAKIFKEFQKDNKDLLSVRAAYVEGSVFSSEQVMQLADLPSREVLLSQLLGCLKAPMGNLAGTLGGILTKFVRTLDAVKEKKSV